MTNLEYVDKPNLAVLAAQLRRAKNVSAVVVQNDGWELLVRTSFPPASSSWRRYEEVRLVFGPPTPEELEEARREFWESIC